MTQPDTHTATLTAALDYAARGWHVFPLHPDTKRPATPGHRAADCLPGGFGGPIGTDAWCRAGHAGWEARATVRPDWIRRAWSSHPYGIGIAAGPSRLVVIDLDTPKPGEEIPEPWRRFGATCGRDVLDMLATTKAGSIVPTWTVRTISGGEHLYYQAPVGARIGNTAGTLGALVDTRARGGYVVAPPTAIAGAAYQVTDDRPAAPLPAWLADLLTARPGRAASGRPARPEPLEFRSARPARPLRDPKAYVDKVLDIALNGDAQHGVTGLLDAPEGRRNVALFSAAATVGKLVARGLITETAATDALLTAAAGHIAAGAYTPYEAEATIRSGFHRAATRRSAA